MRRLVLHARLPAETIHAPARAPPGTQPLPARALGNSTRAPPGTQPSQQTRSAMHSPGALTRTRWCNLRKLGACRCKALTKSVSPKRQVNIENSSGGAVKPAFLRTSTIGRRACFRPANFKIQHLWSGKSLAKASAVHLGPRLRRVTPARRIIQISQTLMTQSAR